MINPIDCGCGEVFGVCENTATRSNTATLPATMKAYSLGGGSSHF